MPINFPSNPANNQVYTYDTQSWYWANNYGLWQPGYSTYNVPGYTGSAGAGYTGSAGIIITDYGLNYAMKTISF